MNVLFFTIENVSSFATRSIYMDLVNEFIEKGHYVTVISACEKRDSNKNFDSYFSLEGKGEIIRFVCPNVTKIDNYLKKGINLLKLIPLYRKQAKKAMKTITYDLVLYGSPPVSVFGAVAVVKRKQKAYSYLLLKDIWPYDCMFGDVLSTNGWKGIAFNVLKHMARRLYHVSDMIGCMSPANIRFLTENEPTLDLKKIEVNPNSIKPYGQCLSGKERDDLRRKYGIPLDKIVFVYGGNIGVAQGIDFALDAVKEAGKEEDAFFVLVGSGTAKHKVEKAYSDNQFKNLKILDAMPKDEYETFVYACDVGLIFLNHECLAPNYPSRLLAYMQASLPVLCATDTYSDVGSIAMENGYGYWCESNDTEAYVNCVRQLCDTNIRTEMGEKSRQYLDENYTVTQSCQMICDKI